MLFIFAVIALAVAPTAAQSCSACFEGTCYIKETLLEYYTLLSQLAVERTNNDLYFHIQNGDPIRDYDIRFQLNNNSVEVTNLGFTYAHAINQATKEIYIGQDQGVIAYHPDTKTYDSIQALADKTIWLLQYKDKLYYIENDVNGLFTFDNVSSSPIPNLSNYTLRDFIVDRNDNIFFIDDNFTLFLLKHGSSVPVQVKVDRLHLTTDRDGLAYFVHPVRRTLYKWDYTNDVLINIGVFTQGRPTDTVFDGDNNIIYHDYSNGGLYYLKASSRKCRVMDEISA